MENLLLAACSHLRANMSIPSGRGDAKSFIGIQPEGRPEAWMGEWYIALDEASVANSAVSHLNEQFTIEVVITKRTGKYPRDRFEGLYTEVATGLRALERQVIRLLHCNQAVRQLANELAKTPGETTGDAYQRPLFYRGRGRTEFHGGDWIGATNGDHAFAVRRLPFVGGDRIQDLDIMQ